MLLSLIGGSFDEREILQEFRVELQAAETKDKKFVKRKTVLKKVVANITMGNDSWFLFSGSRERFCKD
jgi:AP-2 complex subunit beta-1